MSNGVKATMVVVGLMSLCGIAVIGPILGDAGNSAVQTVLGFDNETEVANRKTRTVSDYNETGALKKARECCVTCKTDWDYIGDRCTLRTQQDTSCYIKCAQ
jgi:hypothetical protein